MKQDMNKNEKIKYGYMCTTDFDWELGDASGGVRVYSSVEDLKKHMPCVENCGIVKVAVKIVEIIESGKEW